MAAGGRRLADRFAPLTLLPLSAHACVHLSGGASSMRQGSLPLAARGERAGVRGLPLAIFLIAAVTAARPAPADPVDRTVAEWPHFGGDAGGGRYSPLTQIDKCNVAELKVIWEYHTGDVSTAATAAARARSRRPRSSPKIPCI